MQLHGRDGHPVERGILGALTEVPGGGRMGRHQAQWAGLRAPSWFGTAGGGQGGRMRFRCSWAVEKG